MSSLHQFLRRSAPAILTAVGLLFAAVLLFGAFVTDLSPWQAVFVVAAALVVGTGCWGLGYLLDVGVAVEDQLRRSATLTAQLLARDASDASQDRPDVPPSSVRNGP